MGHAWYRPTITGQVLAQAAEEADDFAGYTELAGAFADYNRLEIGGECLQVLPVVIN